MKKLIVVLFLLIFTIQVIAQSEQCSEFLNLVLERVADACQNTGRNEICFGNVKISATPTEINNTEFEFSEVGDIESIFEISDVALSDLNIEEGTLGIALARIQANIPNTLPGQNVLAVFIGDVDSSFVGGETVTGFTFHAGIGRSNTCQEIPPSGVMIKTPPGLDLVDRASFTVNDTEIELGSTMFVWTPSEVETVGGLFNGHAWYTQNGVTVDMGAGSQISTMEGSVPQPKEDFEYFEHPGAVAVSNWVNNLVFNDEPCLIEILSETFVRVNPRGEAFRVLYEGYLNVIGRFGDSWLIDKAQIDRGYNAIQLWINSGENVVLHGNCINVPEIQPAASIPLQPTAAPLAEITVEATASIPVYTNITANPTNLTYLEESTDVCVSVFHANSAQLFISYSGEFYDVAVDSNSCFTLTEVPVGESYVNLIVYDLANNRSDNYYVITRNSP